LVDWLASHVDQRGVKTASGTHQGIATPSNDQRPDVNRGDRPMSSSPVLLVPLARRPRRGECRFCGEGLRRTFVDLGSSPLCQRHIEPESYNEMEPTFPLHVWVCERCFLVQLEEYVSPAEIFHDYAYFSSFSDTWLDHARRYALAMSDWLSLGPESFVVELASNDGYLLQFFRERRIHVLGVEPAENVAKAAMAREIPTLVRFFGRSVAADIVREHGHADLIVANNVLAHVPDINDFVGGVRALLGPRGVVTMEFPHLARLIAGNQFDTIYHEHFSYLSFSVVERIFSAQGLTVFDVEELPTFGGSLRVYACHAEDGLRPVGDRVDMLREQETHAGVFSFEYYETFGERVKNTKRRLLSFLIAAKDAGKSIAAYGAPGKGNTLLNYCGVRTDFIDYTVDRNPKKQGNHLPGSRIPIRHPEEIRRTRPDYLLILPWNLKEEIMTQNAFIREWGGRFVLPIPQVQVLG
jgi:SAM-dependent methyltransferase